MFNFLRKAGAFTYIAIGFFASILTISPFGYKFYQWAFEQGAEEQRSFFREQLMSNISDIPPQEYKGVEYQFLGCEKVSATRLTCEATIKAIDKDLTVALRKFSKVYDNQGNEADFLSISMQNGDIKDGKGYCSIGIPLIKGVPTKIKFNFKAPSDSYLKVSALKLELFGACMGSEKTLTFYDLPV